MSTIKQITLPILGMTCANCVAAVEKTLDQQNGIEKVLVNLSSERAFVSYDLERINLNDIIADRRCRL